MIYTKMYHALLTTCTTDKEKMELMEQIITEAIDIYNGDVELAIKNRYECDMCIDDIKELQE
jgi:vacuolar-type H+-ATPase subunit C/Vma6